MEKLREYRKKRDFGRTGEPSGESGGKKKDKKLKYVVQYHVATRTHYDFRLEWRGVLLSWAVPKGPSFRLGDRRLAVMVEDHPVEYADFEGVIPKGEYGGGPVMLWDEGSWEPENDPDEGLREGSLKFRVEGERLKGRWALVRMKTEDGDKNWLLLKERDEYARADEGIPEVPSSVRSGRTVSEILAEEDPSAQRNPFQSAEVELAKLAERVPEGKGWLFEVKFDGYRILAFTEGGETRLLTRGGKDFSDKFRRVADAISAWAKGRAAVLDGEMVVPDEKGRTDFQALQSYVKRPDGKSLVYMAFDLLALDGEDLRERPLIERKTKLAEILEDAPDCLKVSRHVEDKGKESLKAAEKAGFEGIVAKRADSPYRGERNGDWVKLKCYLRQEFVLGGCTRTGKKEGVSALLLGVYEGKDFRYAGRAGTGLTLKAGAELYRTLKAYVIPEPAFENPPRRRSGEETLWLKPALVCEVQFAEWTGEGVLRQASFKGLREDKDPREVVRERAAEEETAPPNGALPEEETVPPNEAALEKKPKKSAKKPAEDSPEVCGIPISSPGKIVFKRPEVTKLEVVRYYERAAPRMLAYAEGRVLSVVRCHKGVGEACFFKKHPAGESAGTKIVPVENSEGEVSDYFCLKDERGLISEAQLGTIEFHVWGSREKTLEKPDMMVFDLDPDEGMPLDKVRQGVRDLKSVLDALGLKSFLKTTGGKGYHVVLPFRPSVGWEAFHDFARRIAEVMAEKWPERYTANMRKSKRQGRIFIDWVRNGRGATSVAPYSLRARPGAKVSVPLAWSELDRVAPDGIDLFGALERLKKSDPWKDYFRVDQELK